MEEFYGLIEIIDHLLLRVVVRIAMRLQCADTSAMFVPLVFPQVRIVALVVFPELAHFIEQVAASGVNQYQ